MKAASKVVLFAHVRQGSKETQRPVGIFGDEHRARTYANVLHIAYRTGDVKTVHALDERAPFGEDDHMPPVPKFSIVALPYDPAPFAAGADSDVMISSEAS